jgi:hypothetical protein
VDVELREDVLLRRGTWRWKVSYLGDDENQPSTSDCGVEQFTIQNG